MEHISLPNPKTGRKRRVENSLDRSARRDGVRISSCVGESNQGILGLEGAEAAASVATKSWIIDTQRAFDI